LGRVSPLLEAGPAFRTTGNLNTNPSHTGLTAGTGAGLEWRGLRLEPTLRYTRWTADPAWTTPSKQDQLELLFGVSRGAVTDRHPFGRRVSLGGVTGATLVRPVRDVSYTSWIEFATSRTYFRTWIVGPRAEAGITDRWSALAEANHRQIRYRENFVVRFR
jgi:hypothetical protein